MKTASIPDYANLNLIIWYVLGNLVPFVQFKNREKYPWRSVTFSKITESNVF